MAQEVLLYISLIIGIAAILTIIARVIRQPPIIAYLATGVLVGPLFFKLIGPSTASSEIIQVFAHIGVALLLFIVGLNLDFRLLKEIGRVSAIAGLSQIILTGGVGYLIAISLGFSTIAALYIATAITFSSTVIVVKILSDKKEIGTLHGRISHGILIIQDFVAAIALMAVPILKEGGGISVIAKELGTITLVIIAISIFSTFILGRFLNYLARNQEVLFLFGIGWALTLASLFDYIGFSIEIGALIAGISLASSKYTIELGGKIKPLRDFFVVLFFIFFGSQLAGVISQDIIIKAIIFSAFVIIGKPLIVMTILRIYGYSKRTNFLTATSLAQISEFSLILILLGFNLGQISQEIMSLTVLIAIITIGISSYSTYYAHYIFNKVSRLLIFFEGEKYIKDKSEKKSYDIILLGYHRIGYRLLKTIKEMGNSFVVVDYNPKVILSLEKEGIDAIFGDAGDKDFLNEIELSKAKLVISTVPDEESNLAIREKLKETKSKAIFIGTAEQSRTALDLYNKGVDYVIVPQHLGGDYASQMIKTFGIDKEKYKEKGRKHLIDIKRGKDNSSFI